MGVWEGISMLAVSGTGLMGLDEALLFWPDASDPRDTLRHKCNSESYESLDGC